MNSMQGESGEGIPIQTSHFERQQPVDFTLTIQQYIILQHRLPKRYALIDHKHIKKGNSNSAVKLANDQTQNLSRLSGNVENTQENQGRIKRIRIKKIDKFLEQEPLVNRKIANQLPTEDEFVQCHYILNQLKKHKNSFPFLQPVDPKRDEVFNYFDVIKEPMDLSTIESNLANGIYTSSSQFHAHINKIWFNSYTYNQKGSGMNKITLDLEKYYKNLLTHDGSKKTIKMDKNKSKMQKSYKVELPEEDLRKSENYPSKDYVYENNL